MARNKKRPRLLADGRICLTFERAGQKIGLEGEVTFVAANQ